MLCANYPDAPSAPTLVLGSLDIVEVAWNLPTYNGGSSVQGFLLYVKWSTAADYTLVWDGRENLSTKTYRLEKNDHLGNVMIPGSLEFAVSAKNWVGESPKSTILTVVLTQRTDAATAVLSGPGFGATGVLSAVAQYIDLQSKNADGTNQVAGGQFFFLHVQ